jgi:hypothetical protein
MELNFRKSADQKTICRFGPIVRVFSVVHIIGCNVTLPQRRSPTGEILIAEFGVGRSAFDVFCESTRWRCRARSFFPLGIG